MREHKSASALPFCFPFNYSPYYKQTFPYQNLFLCRYCSLHVSRESQFVQGLFLKTACSVYWMKKMKKIVCHLIANKFYVLSRYFHPFCPTLILTWPTSSWKRRFGNRVGETEEPVDPINPAGFPINKVVQTIKRRQNWIHTNCANRDISEIALAITKTQFRKHFGFGYPFTNHNHSMYAAGSFCLCLRVECWTRVPSLCAQQQDLPRDSRRWAGAGISQ